MKSAFGTLAGTRHFNYQYQSFCVTAMSQIKGFSHWFEYVKHI